MLKIKKNTKKRTKIKKTKNKRKQTLKKTLGDAFFIFYKRQLTSKDTKKHQKTPKGVS